MKATLWIGTILGYFLLGPGYLLFTPRKVLGAFLTLGAIGATYVEQALLPGGAIAGGEPDAAFKIMFVSFFLLALGCAIDGHLEIKKSLEAGESAG